MIITLGSVSSNQLSYVLPRDLRLDMVELTTAGYGIVSVDRSIDITWPQDETPNENIICHFSSVGGFGGAVRRLGLALPGGTELWVFCQANGFFVSFHLSEIGS